MLLISWGVKKCNHAGYSQTHNTVIEPWLISKYLLYFSLAWIFRHHIPLHWLFLCPPPFHNFLSLLLQPSTYMAFLSFPYIVLETSQTCLSARDFSDNAWKWHQKAIHKFKVIGIWGHRRTIPTNLSSHWYQFWLPGAAWVSTPRVRGLVALTSQLLERKTRRGFPRCWVTATSISCQRRNQRALRWKRVLLTSLGLITIYAQ